MRTCDNLNRFNKKFKMSFQLPKDDDGGANQDNASFGLAESNYNTTQDNRGKPKDPQDF